jgi:hypothetical protein
MRSDGGVRSGRLRSAWPSCCLDGRGPLRRLSLAAWRGRADANADAPPTAGLVAPGELDGQPVPPVPSAETAAGLVPYSDSDSSGDEGEAPPQKRQKPRALQDKTNAPVEPQPASVPAAEVRGSPRSTAS